ncbi:uncharacterized protein LOC122303528 isoform X2 [Carya illinoinensis]|uniref:RIN4 pathogenic type III effector avirulence factor Avr cleavage site domain-containing protein n=1 Tax=Carya illinoinensis TaxID=32201 RepID=A0A8T1R3D3_CARIL|nr:uncharacterized protein LOC122303528 isoform X2 [Carya illinoinensis]KAG6660863.1 hypothetical protein CIPAW_03G134100 [Carya illinoinensis]
MHTYFLKNAPWLSVPQFGDWDHKGQVPDYSLDFSKIREMRKLSKMDVSRVSLGNDEELIGPTTTTTTTTNTNTNASSTQSDNHRQHLQHDYPESQHSPTTRRSFLSCFNCYGKA